MPRAPATPAAERRADAVRALLELAADTAPDQISTAAVAGRMGVSHGALFRHFPSREALWTEAVHWSTGELERRIQALAGQVFLDPDGEVVALLKAHSALVQAHPGLLRLWFAELQRPGTSLAREEGKAFMGRFRRQLQEVIAAGQARHWFEPGLDPAELAGLLVAVYQGLMLQGLAHDSLDQLGERTEKAVGLILRGWHLRPPGEAAPAAAPGG
jgi:TetR/AcrR family transcriptional regulator